MVALCIPVAPLVMAPSRRVVYKAGAPRNTLRHHTLRVRRRQVVKARQPSMIFGLQRMFNWLTPTDIGAAVICTYFVIRRLRMIDSDPTANTDDDDEDGAVNRGNKLFKKLSGANYNYVAQSDEDLAALRTMCCKKCGFTIFVAKDRLKRHFVKGLECLQCGAKAPDFYNENDPDDPVLSQCLVQVYSSRRWRLRVSSSPPRHRRDAFLISRRARAVSRPRPCRAGEFRRSNS